MLLLKQKSIIKIKIKNIKNILPSTDIVGEFSNLTLVELLTLQRLKQHQEPVVRYFLYQEINQLIHPKLKKQYDNDNNSSNNSKPPKLSTSSFYNSLKTLASRKLVKFNYGESSKKSGKRKIETVEATENAKLILNSIYEYFLVMMIDDLQYYSDVSKDVMKKIGVSHFKSFFTVNITDEVDFKVIQLFSELSDQLYLLAWEDSYEDIQKSGFENLHLSYIIDDRFREPDNLFDVSIALRYEKDLSFYNLSRIDLLKEMKRVTREGGVVIVPVRSKLPKIDNFYGNELFRVYSNAIGTRFFTNDELEADLIEAGYSKIDIFEYKGMIVGIGWG